MSGSRELEGYYAPILAQLQNLRWPAGQANGTAWCPVHEADPGRNHSNSLSIRFGRDGELLLRCHGDKGCSFADIVAALGRPKRDFFFHPERSGPAPPERQRHTHTFAYTDEHGELAYESLRFEPKAFILRRPDPDRPGAWINNVEGVPRYPYHLPDIVASAEAGRMIFVVEGELKVELLEGIGFVATCNAGGSEKWPVEWAQWFQGRAVTIIPDHDEKGWRHAGHVARCLQGMAGPTRIMELPGLRHREDVIDWYKRVAGYNGVHLKLAVELIKRNALAAPIFDIKGDPQVKLWELRCQLARALALSGSF